VPTLKERGAEKPPLPFPRITLTVLPALLVRIRSSLPSELTSAAVTEAGENPMGMDRGSLNEPSALRSDRDRKEVESEKIRSVWPSPVNRPAVTVDGNSTP